MKSLITISLAALLGSSAGAAYAQTEQDPAKFYTEFHAKMRDAKSVLEILPYMAADKVKQIKDDEAKMTKQQFTGMFEFIKMMSPSKVQIVKTEPGKADDCLLSLTADGQDDPLFGQMVKDGKMKETTTGTVHLIKEGGNWKIEKESWKSSAVSSDSASAPDSTSATDTNDAGGAMTRIPDNKDKN